MNRNVERTIFKFKCLGYHIENTFTFTKKIFILHKKKSYLIIIPYKSPKKVSFYQNFRNFGDIFGNKMMNSVTNFNRKFMKRLFLRRFFSWKSLSHEWVLGVKMLISNIIFFNKKHFYNEFFHQKDDLLTS